MQITYLSKDFYPEYIKDSQTPTVREKTIQFLKQIEDLNIYQKVTDRWQKST